ncbi:hypothetical protein MMC17_003628 [Xylographa soralifera]|nr:hypothetical protein [Xylographa soralifera]
MSSFPPSPVSDIDWNSLGFKTTSPVNGHIQSSYSIHTGQWSAPEFITNPYLPIHGMCPGLNYGLQAFEGIKAFRTPHNQLAIFRPHKNAARLHRSAAFLAIPTVPQAHFLKCVGLAVGLNAAFVPPHATGAAMYIRPLLFGSAPQLTLAPPEEYLFCVYVSPTGTYHGARPLDALVLEDLDRAAPVGTGSLKIGGNYAPVFRFAADAREDGFGITLHLDSKTRSEIDEFSTSGFIGVKVEGDSVTLVVPDSKNVLQSVTSDSACQIAASFGWTVEHRRIPYSELDSFTEVIAVGTAAALVPVKSITMRSTGDKFLYGDGSEEPGPVVSRLLTTLRDIQMGKIEDTFGWLDYVKDPKDVLME